MNIFAHIRENIVRTIEELGTEGRLPAGIDVSRVTAEPPRYPAHWDVATNAAMVLASQAGMKPRDFAALLAEKMGALRIVEKVEIAGRDFVNSGCQRRLEECLKEFLKRERNSDLRYGKGQKATSILSANRPARCNVGHGRGVFSETRWPNF